MQFPVTDRALINLGVLDPRARATYISTMNGALQNFVTPNNLRLIMGARGQDAMREVIEPLIRWSNPNLPSNSGGFLATAFINDTIMNSQQTAATEGGLVTTAGVTPGSFASGGLASVVNSIVSGLLARLGITGVRALALTTPISTVVTNALTSALGTGQLMNRGLSNEIAIAITPTVTSLINGVISPLSLPEAIVQPVVNSVVNLVLTPILDRIL